VTLPLLVCTLRRPGSIVMPAKVSAASAGSPLPAAGADAAWAEYNLDLLAGHELSATATTGHLLQRQLGLPVTCFRSGPYGGDQQIGARIAEGGIDLLVFFWDPLEPHPHDPDVKALLRVAVVCNIPVACNRATADFMISSPLMGRRHQAQDPAPGQARHDRAALRAARAS
jgi:methylglyoxal synthase